MFCTLVQMSSCSPLLISSSVLFPCPILSFVNTGFCLTDCRDITCGVEEGSFKQSSLSSFTTLLLSISEVYTQLQINNKAEKQSPRYLWQSWNRTAADNNPFLRWSAGHAMIAYKRGILKLPQKYQVVLLIDRYLPLPPEILVNDFHHQSHLRI